MTATPEALARIPETTLPSLLVPRRRRGDTPPGTDWAGRPKWHAADCSADGGPGLPPGVCRRCAMDLPMRTYSELLGRLDRLAGGR